SSNTPPITLSFKHASSDSPESIPANTAIGSGKLNVPSRRNRNRPASRVHDIEFATEISTSLLAQVRQLQNLLSERDEALKSANLEKSRLELEAEGFAQRIHILDESEQRYKDENWTLELRNQELYNQIRDLTEKEERLTSNLKLLEARQSGLQKEVDDVKAANSRLLEEQLAAQKKYDAEVHTLRRTVNSGEAERTALQKKLQEVTGQNQELVRAVAMKFREQETSPGQRRRDIASGDESDGLSDGTPQNSPPPSPGSLRPTPLRNKNLESETLKSSLHHAQRMIQNLKNTIHREKSEKMELKRMLQEARDEVETRRKEPGTPGGALGASSSTNLRRPKSKSIVFKKPPLSLLGKGRRAETEIEEVKEHDPLRDADWEDHPSDGGHNAGSARPGDRKSDENVGPPPTKMLKTRHGQSGAEEETFSLPSNQPRRIEDENVSPKHVPTMRLAPLQSAMTTPANRPLSPATTTDTEAFETANERDTATETEGFQTGMEELDDSSDTVDAGTETETEVTPSNATSKQRRGLAKAFSMKTMRPSAPQTPRRNKIGNLQQGSRDSFMSTASASDEEGEEGPGDRSRRPPQPPSMPMDLSSGVGFGAGLASGFGMGSALEQRKYMQQLHQQNMLQQQQQHNGQNPPRYRLRLSRSRRASSKPSLYGGSNLSNSTSINIADNTASTNLSNQDSPALSLVQLSRTRTGSVSTLGGPNGPAPGQSLFAELDEDDFEGNGSGSGSDDPDAVYRVSSPAAATLNMEMQSVPSTPNHRNMTPASRQAAYGSGYAHAYNAPTVQGNRLRRVMEGVAMVDESIMTLEVPLEEMEEVQEIVEREVAKRQVHWNLERENEKEFVETVPVEKEIRNPELSLQKAVESNRAETEPVAKVRVYQFKSSGTVTEVQSVPLPSVSPALGLSGVRNYVMSAPVGKKAPSLAHSSATLSSSAETKPVRRLIHALSANGVVGFAETKPVSRAPIPLVASVHETTGTAPVARTLHPPALTLSSTSFADTAPVETKGASLSFADKLCQETAPVAKQPCPLTIARVHEDDYVSTEPVVRKVGNAALGLSEIDFQRTVPVEGKTTTTFAAGDHKHIDTVPAEGKKGRNVAAFLGGAEGGRTREFTRSEMNTAETEPRSGLGASLLALGGGASGIVAGAAGALAGEHVLHSHTDGEGKSALKVPEFDLAHFSSKQHASTSPVTVGKASASTVGSPSLSNYTTSSAATSVETSPSPAYGPQVRYVHASPTAACIETKPVAKLNYIYTPELGISIAGSAVETVPVEKKEYIPELSLSGTQPIVLTVPAHKKDSIPELASSGLLQVVETMPVDRKETTPNLSVSGLECVETAPVQMKQLPLEYITSSVFFAETQPVQVKRKDTTVYTFSDVTLAETIPTAAVKPAFVLNKSGAHKFAETLPLPPAVTESTFSISRSELQAAETTPVNGTIAAASPAVGLGFDFDISGVTSAAQTKPVDPVPTACNRSGMHSGSTEVSLLPEPLVPKKTVVWERSTIFGEGTVPKKADTGTKGWLGAAGAAVAGGALGLGLGSHDYSSHDESGSRPVTALYDADSVGRSLSPVAESLNVGSIVRTSGPSSPSPEVRTSEDATQTIVTSHLIDQLLLERHNSRSVSASTSVTHASTAILSHSASGLSVPGEDDESMHTTPKAKSLHSRNNSVLSQRTMHSYQSHHPYTSPVTNHSQVSLNQSLALSSSTNNGSPSINVPQINEHPQHPAQLSPQQPPQQQYGIALISPTYRLGERPRTPSGPQQQSLQQQQQQHGIALVGPTCRLSERPRTPAEQAARRRPHTPSTVRRESNPSHRSSLSSFGSVDHRLDAGAQNQGCYPFGSGTDLRMIQAITETMIGEWLWKYTRNLGRTGLSSTRHQRYVWVHPYTRTLYWSTRDPQADGSQHNSKSMPIESVREVQDDNPYPPGICSKSLEIVTPARTVKFTAQTGQRHETWYNALRYLLLRTTPEEEAGRDQPEQTYPYTAYSPFNATPTLRSPTRTQNSLRVSASLRTVRRSNSRTSTSASRRTASIRGASSVRAPSFFSHPDANSLRAKRDISSSRLSSMFHQTHTHAGRPGSFRTRRVRARPSTAEIANPHSMSADSQIRQSTETSMHSGNEYPVSFLSAADLEGLENVRACCGGKHDVGSLCRTHARHDPKGNDGR
ncbi:hypothetical protein KEM54_005736, partial [Ascosphaera aggregata]